MDGAPTDAAAEASETAPTGGCNGAIACQRVVFVTSASGPAFTLGGLAGADAKCTAHAEASGNPRLVGRSYLAWLSDSSGSPATRMAQGTGEYVRPDGARIARSFGELTDASAVKEAISVDENGATRTGPVWTGTGANGERSGGNCGGWRSTVGDGARGVIGSSTRTWTTAGQIEDGEPGDCVLDLARIYCVEK